MRLRFLRALMPALLGALLLVQPLMAAAPAQERRFGLDCQAGVCTAKFDLGIDSEWLADGVWLSVLQTAVTALPGGEEFVVRDDVSISMPSGSFTLADAELVVTLDDLGNVATLRGSALAPVPTFALFEGLAFVTPARVTVGFDRGDILALSHLTLDPARRYLFLDAQAGMSVATQGMALDTPAGQRATLVFDPTQPAVYLDGQLTLRTNGELAFLGDNLADESGEGWFASLLPLVHTTKVHAQAGVGIEPSLQVNSGLALDGGIAGRWLQLDATPFTTTGWAKISPAGLLVAGEARVAVAPTQWLDSHAEAELFVPFDATSSANVVVGAGLTSPALDVDQELTVEVVGEPGWVARAADATWRGVRDSVAQGGEAIGTGYGWLEDGTAAGWAQVQRQWCGYVGGCEIGVDEGGQRVAEAR